MARLCGSVNREHGEIRLCQRGHRDLADPMERLSYCRPCIVQMFIGLLCDRHYASTGDSIVICTDKDSLLMELMGVTNRETNTRIFCIV